MGWGRPVGHGPYREVAAARGPLVEIRARRPAGSVGTVSHRPFSGLSGEVGMARETRALPGVAAAWGPLVEIRARRPAGLVGTVSHRPFPGLSGEVGMARETRALPGGGRPGGPRRWWVAVGRDGVSPSVPWAVGRGGDGPRDSGPTGGGSGLGPLVEIRARRPAGLVGMVSHRPFPCTR